MPARKSPLKGTMSEGSVMKNRLPRNKLMTNVLAMAAGMLPLV
jgi:hypothetical protein